MTVPDKLPAYKDLPTKGGVDHVSWGLFGDDDQVGMFNLQTPERIVEAARLVRKGSLFPLNWKLEMPAPPLYGRGALRQTISRVGNIAHDDVYDNFFPQSSSQWDALCHVGDGFGTFYNGVKPSDVTGQEGAKAGIEHWARRGLAGRCVLLDFGRYYQQQNGRPIDGGEVYRISVDELEATRKAQNVEIRTGDVLLIRCGWMEWYEQRTDDATRQHISVMANLKTPGIAPGEDMAEYIWDLGVSAVASDAPALEAWPPPMFEGQDSGPGQGFLHFYILGRFGMAIGEMFYLEQLAADCAADGVYEAFFASAPLNKLGGIGSPPNALAIK
jgi:kynurenine formamidase